MPGQATAESINENALKYTYKIRAKIIKCDYIYDKCLLNKSF
jgi:hypothetical protein